MPHMGTVSPARKSGEWSRPWTSQRPPASTPSCDVPGLSKSDIQVTTEEDNILVMKSASNDGGSSASNDGGGSANRKWKREEEEGDCWHVQLERHASPRSFVRKVRLPEDADAGAVDARCENGVLTITITKRPPPEKKTNSVQVVTA